MTRARNSRRPRYLRKFSGQALAEGSAFLLIFVPIAVAAVLMIIVTATLGYYHLKLAEVADAGARAGCEERFWLGAERITFAADKGASATTTIQNTTSSIWTNLNLPGKLNTEVSWQPTYVEVTVKVTGVPVLSGGWLPATVSLTDAAIEPYSINRPISIYAMQLPQAPMEVLVPSYGVKLNNNNVGYSFPGVADHSLPEDWLFYASYFSPTAFYNTTYTDLDSGTSGEDTKTGNGMPPMLNGPTTFNELGTPISPVPDPTN